MNIDELAREYEFARAGENLPDGERVKRSLDFIKKLLSEDSAEAVAYHCPGMKSERMESAPGRKAVYWWPMTPWEAFFALNGGVFSGKSGHIFYLAPDILDWEELEIGYSDFVHWALTGDINKFYESFWWPGWENEVEAISTDQGISVYPFLWAEGPALMERSRKPVPIEELWNLNLLNREKVFKSTP